MNKKQQTAELIGTWLFKIFLYFAVTGLITIATIFSYIKSHEFLGIEPDNITPSLINPFWLLAVMGQFFTFKQIFMKGSSIGFAFISWIGITVGLIILGAIAMTLIP